MTQTHTDELTGLPGRAAFDEFLSLQVETRLRVRLPRALGLVRIDVDRFETFDEVYGLGTGDEVLRRVGQVIHHRTRKGDLAARYGEEEFAVIAPQTNPFGLKTLTERLRRAIEGEVLEVGGQTLSLTASLGAACISVFRSEDDAKRLLKLADHFLDRAKRNGCNRGEIHPTMRFPAA